VDISGHAGLAGGVGGDRGINREEYDRALDVVEQFGLRLDALSLGDRFGLARAI
jgi:hypothetical protein